MEVTPTGETADCAHLMEPFWSLPMLPTLKAIVTMCHELTLGLVLAGAGTLLDVRRAALHLSRLCYQVLCLRPTCRSTDRWRVSVSDIVASVEIEHGMLTAEEDMV